MSTGHVVLSEQVFDSMSIECRALFDTFINRGKIVSTQKCKNGYDFTLDHPDFDSEKYGEDAEYALHFTKGLDVWHNTGYHISKLSVWSKDHKISLVKDYTRKGGIVYE